MKKNEKTKKKKKELATIGPNLMSNLGEMLACVGNVQQPTVLD